MKDEIEAITKKDPKFQEAWKKMAESGREFREGFEFKHAQKENITK